MIPQRNKKIHFQKKQIYQLIFW